jgi:hypothetical protein
MTVGGGTVSHSWANTAKVVSTQNRGDVAAADLLVGDIIEVPPDGTPATLTDVVVNEHED